MIYNQCHLNILQKQAIKPCYKPNKLTKKHTVFASRHLKSRNNFSDRQIYRRKCKQFKLTL